MNEKTIDSVTSKDPFLLMRLITELQLEGVKEEDSDWNLEDSYTYKDPESFDILDKEITVYTLQFPDDFEVTEENYEEALQGLLNFYKEN